MKHILIKIEERLAMVFFAATTVLVFSGAVGRVFGHPLIWSVDLAQVAFAWACVLGADIALKRDSHIKIDVFSRRFPGSLSRPLALLWQLAMAAFLMALVWYGTDITLMNLERELGDAGISYGWVTGTIPAGGLLMLGTTLARIWGDLSGKERLVLAGHDGTVM